jgi:hypothetical protein
MICGAYYIPAAGGGFGLVSETFVLDAPAAAPKAVKKNKGLKQAFKHYQIPSRFQPKSALKIEEMAK